MANYRSVLTRYGLASAAVAALVVPLTVVATAAPASANAPCGSARPADNDNRAYVNQTAGVSANMRNGSGTSCPIVGWVDNQDRMDYHCWTYNSTMTATWTYLRNVTDGTYGWVSDSLLPVRDGVPGSNVRCPAY
ncbi:SH3 domain-containing protein [Streptomyces sp. 4F14]|uniref:SH3 domain-containing protein n=1 Tax=Streptomyces sp. 4F14 TaxID=3394380 RepID=UPI003A8BB2A2